MTVPYTFASASSPIPLSQLDANFVAVGVSSNVSYNQGATGSVARTVQAKLQESISVLDFGADPTGVADSLAAFNAAIASFSSFNSGYSGNGGVINVPPGTYKISNTLWIDKTIQLIGQSSPYPYNEGVSRIKFTNAGDGIVFGWISGTYQTPSGTQGGGALIKNLYITTTATTGTGNGIVINSKCSVEDVYLTGFKGHGIYAYAIAPTNGNANNFQIKNVKSYGNNLCGLYVVGADVNAGFIQALDASLNGQWGVYDSSFLGNTYIACHTSGNGSGAYKSDNPNARNLFLNCYSESDQPTSVISAPAIMIGGIHGGAQPTGTGIFIRDGYINNVSLTADGTTSMQAGYGGSIFGFSSTGDTNVWNWGKLAANTYGYTYANLSSPYYQPFKIILTSSDPRTGSAGIQLDLQMGFSVGYDTVKRYVSTGSAAPTTGTWVQGDRILNSAPTSGGYSGWICTASGTPGTWKTFGLIS